MQLTAGRLQYAHDANVSSIYPTSQMGRIIATPPQPVKESDMALTKKQRAELRMKFGGRCAYCGCELPEKGWHADHVEAVRRNISNGYAMDRPENDTISNMVPACIPCNLFKMCSTVEDFRSRIATQVDVTRRASRSYRTAESFGLIQPTNAPVVFWFEKYQEGATA